MKALFVATIAMLTLGAGIARAQEPKAHEHEHAQPPAVAEENDDKAEHKDMCACCMKGGMAAMQDKMQDKMKGKNTDTK